MYYNNNESNGSIIGCFSELMIGNAIIVAIIIYFSQYWGEWYQTVSWGEFVWFIVKLTILEMLFLTSVVLALALLRRITTPYQSVHEQLKNALLILGLIGGNLLVNWLLFPEKFSWIKSWFV